MTTFKQLFNTALLRQTASLRPHLMRRRMKKWFK